MTPYYQTDDVTIYHGDCREVLPTLEAQSVQCCVTSPPYWGLRDYGTAVWECGDEDCDHADAYSARHGGWDGNNKNPDGTPRTARQAGVAGKCARVCPKCGAQRVDAQLGLEETPEEYVENMVDVFREVWRVLRDDGTLWLNLGDTYNSGMYGGRDPERWPKQARNDHLPKRGHTGTLKHKDLVGIPWRVAFALQADGWTLRQDIIWQKPNPMPESVTDRCTKAHEYIFLLSKSAKYHYDAEAIREPDASTDHKHRNVLDGQAGLEPSGGLKSPHTGLRTIDGRNGSGRNKRSVWTVTTKPFKGAHFATFPPDLIEPCILAGTSDHGCCSECGAPWKRTVERGELQSDSHGGQMQNTQSDKRDTRDKGWSQERGFGPNLVRPTITTGWEPTCKCVFLRLRDDVPAAIIDELRSLGLV